METGHVYFHSGTKLRIQELKVVPCLTKKLSDNIPSALPVPTVLSPPPEGSSLTFTKHDQFSSALPSLPDDTGKTSSGSHTGALTIPHPQQHRHHRRLCRELSVVPGAILRVIRVLSNPHHNPISKYHSYSQFIDKSTEA